MDSLLFVLGVAVLAFCAGMLGLKLHDKLPEQHAPEKSREMIGAMTGLLGLLLALVLGTLVGSAYALYAAQKAEIETLSAALPATRLGARGVRARGAAGARRPQKGDHAKLREHLGPRDGGPWQHARQVRARGEQRCSSNSSRR